MANGDNRGSGRNRNVGSLTDFLGLQEDEERTGGSRRRSRTGNRPTIADPVVASATPAAAAATPAAAAATIAAAPAVAAPSAAEQSLTSPTGGDFAEVDRLASGTGANRAPLLSPEFLASAGQEALFRAQPVTSQFGATDAQGNTIGRGTGTFNVVGGGSSAERAQGGAGAGGDNSGLGTGGATTLLDEANARQGRQRSINQAASDRSAINTAASGFAARRDRRNTRLGARAAAGLLPREQGRAVRAQLAGQFAAEDAARETARLGAIGDIGTNRASIDATAATAAQAESGRNRRAAASNIATERAAEDAAFADLQAAQASNAIRQQEFLQGQSETAANTAIRLGELNQKGAASTQRTVTDLLKARANTDTTADGRLAIDEQLRALGINVPS